MTKIGVKIFLNILTWDLVENTCWTAKRLLLRSSEQDGTKLPCYKRTFKIPRSFGCKAHGNYSGG